MFRSLRPSQASCRSEATAGVSDEVLVEEDFLTHSDLSASETRTSVETDTVAASAAVDFDLAGIRLEALSGVFGGDTALNGETTLGDSFLRKTELGEGSTGGDLDLSGNDVDASNLL